MQQPVFYTAGETAALRYAKNTLQQWGHIVSPIPSCHVTHLLLPVPSFERPDILKGGYPLTDSLKHLPETITVLGGNLPQIPYRCIDFLKGGYYLWENAGITAQCAAKILQQREPDGACVLIIGWGRIGKQLLPLLRELGCNVTIAVRRENIFAQLTDLGISAVLISQWQPRQYDIIVNTAPAPLLSESQAHPEAFLLDLASVQGILGNRVLWERGLPNRYAPELSGTLIAKTALRYALGKE